MGASLHQNQQSTFFFRSVFHCLSHASTNLLQLLVSRPFQCDLACVPGRGRCAEARGCELDDRRSRLHCDVFIQGGGCRECLSWTLFVASFFDLFKLEKLDLVRSHGHTPPSCQVILLVSFHLPPSQPGLRQHRTLSSLKDPIHHLRSQSSQQPICNTSPLHPHSQVLPVELLTMSYYLTLIGTRDNPLYETEITPKTVAFSSSAASSSSGYFSSSSSATAVGSSSGNAMSEGSSGGGMFGGLLSRIPTTSSALTSSNASTGTVGGASAAGSAGRRKQRYELQMIAHSALDTIEDALVTSPYL